MKRSSEKRHWDEFWASSPRMEDTYANDGRLVAFLLSRFDLHGKRVLEVGAGTGRDSLALAEQGAEVWTLDYSDESLRLMQQVAGESLRIVCGDARAIPFRDGAFDIVFHQGLLEHFRNPIEILAENRRVLKEGGHLLIDVPQRYHYYTAMKHALMAVDRWFAGWETEFGAGELRALMEDAGFTVEALYGENLYPPVWYRGVRRVLLKVGIRLPMFPLSSPGMTRWRTSVREAVPQRIRLATSMVIGCLGRRR
jgi:SAM-dependent methyltransferase